MTNKMENPSITKEKESEKEKTVYERYDVIPYLGGEQNLKEYSNYLNNFYWENRDKILHTNHPRWKEFISKLSEALDDKQRGKTDDEFSRTKEILNEMFPNGEIDVFKTIQFFIQYGGCDDVEVFYNVDPEDEEEYDE